MTKQKSILITAIFSILFGAVLFAVSLNSELIKLIILAVFAAPGYAAFVYGFYKWIKAEEPEAAPKPAMQVEAFNYEKDPRMTAEDICSDYIAEKQC